MTVIAVALQGYLIRQSLGARSRVYALTVYLTTQKLRIVVQFTCNRKTIYSFFVYIVENENKNSCGNLEG